LQLWWRFGWQATFGLAAVAVAEAADVAVVVAVAAAGFPAVAGQVEAARREASAHVAAPRAALHRALLRCHDHRLQIFEDQVAVRPTELPAVLRWAICPHPAIDPAVVLEVGPAPETSPVTDRTLAIDPEQATSLDRDQVRAI
jgi:hypothetical protein